MPGTAKRSLTEFVASKRRANCNVCALPDGVRAQIRGASDKRIKQAEVLEWLKVELGIELAGSEIVSHVNAHHEQAPA